MLLPNVGNGDNTAVTTTLSEPTARRHAVCAKGTSASLFTRAGNSPDIDIHLFLGDAVAEWLAC